MTTASRLYATSRVPGHRVQGYALAAVMSYLHTRYGVSARRHEPRVIAAVIRTEATNHD